MSVTLQGEARLRVLSLYKAWRRHIPIMCKDFDIPRTEAQCQAALRSIWHPTTPHIASFYCYPQNINMQRTINMFWKEGVPEKCTSEGYSCDRHDHYQGISIQQCFLSYCLLNYFLLNDYVSFGVLFINFNEAWIVNIFQGQQDLQEVVNHWKQVNLQKTISIFISKIDVSIGVRVNQYSLFQVTHIMAKWFPEDNIEEKPKDFISKFLTGVE